MTFKDHFTDQASEYARHRPTYPAALFEFLASVAPGHDLAWDCATGNGQAALGLTPYFERVVATDLSEGQLRNAFQHEKIIYRRAGAEDSGLDAGSVDLLTVAQALHWFDFDRFYTEVWRVLKPRGVLAAWSYPLHRVTPEIDRVINSFANETLAGCWPTELDLVSNGYRTIPFPFEEIEALTFTIELEWDVSDMLAYFRTWSPTRLYIERNNRDPVDDVAGPLAAAWGQPDQQRKVRWPIALRVGRVP
jgi:ubiquinone/menaquinone biosynthesis C-methylase UbiE